jgi:hypothetical protein
MKKSACGSSCTTWIVVLIALALAANWLMDGQAFSMISDLLQGARDSEPEDLVVDVPEQPARSAEPLDIQPVAFEREPYYPVSGCAHSRLHVGDRAIVSYGSGANGIRTEPDTHPSDNIIYRAPSGEGLWIIDGPVCNYEWILWKVRTDTGHTGWTPESPGGEFWLTPIEAESSAVAPIRDDPATFEVYEKVNGTLQDPYLSESEKREQIRVYQRTYGEEMVATVMRYMPVYQENGTFTSFDTWSRGFVEEYGGQSGNTPLESDPVGSAMSIFFDPSTANITEQLGLEQFSP